jgi:hypothetical protein
MFPFTARNDAATDVTGMRTMGLAQLSNLLWRERDLRELLLLGTEAVGAGAEPSKAADGASDVAALREAIGEVGSALAAELSAVARELGLGPDCRLSDLAAAAPDPWDGIFTEHVEKLLEVTAALTAAEARP